MTLLSTLGSILFIAVGGAVSGYGGAWLMVRRRFKKLESAVPTVEHIKNHPDYNDGKEVKYYGRNTTNSGDSGSSETGTTESNSGSEKTSGDANRNGAIERRSTGGSTTGEPEIKGSTDDSINEGLTGEGRNLPIQSTDESRESDTSTNSDQRDTEEDWPEY